MVACMRMRMLACVCTLPARACAHLRTRLCPRLLPQTKPLMPGLQGQAHSHVPGHSCTTTQAPMCAHARTQLHTRVQALHVPGMQLHTHTHT